MRHARIGHCSGAVTSLQDPPQAVGGVVFADRHDAGRRLAALLAGLRDEHPVVYGIPRGGVPVAAEVASALDAPLDVVVARKIGAPHNPEFAIGAVAEDGVSVLSTRAVEALGLAPEHVQALLARAQRELAERARRYHASRPPVPPAGRTAVLVDDGLATGRSALAAARSLRARGAARVVLAVPVAAPASVRALRREADEVVCVEAPQDMWAVGYWYDEFAPTAEEEVEGLLAASAARAREGKPAREPGSGA